ncbi:MAG: hypothetical protein RR846_00760 [Oscillospiraceae bacterium]
MYNEIISAINKLLDSSEKDVIIVAIDGPSSAGKSNLANILGQNFCCNIFHMDDFFLTAELRTPQRLAEAGGNVDYDRFAREILENVIHKNDFSYGIYDCRALSTKPSEKIFHKRLNIVEGVYSNHPTLEDYYDFKVFLDVNSTVQLERIAKRNGEFLFNRFKDEWIPLENAYFEKLEIQDNCDVLFDTTNLY